MYKVFKFYFTIWQNLVKNTYCVSFMGEYIFLNINITVPLSSKIIILITCKYTTMPDTRMVASKLIKLGRFCLKKTLLRAWTLSFVISRKWKSAVIVPSNSVPIKDNQHLICPTLMITFCSLTGHDLSSKFKVLFLHFQC